MVHAVALGLLAAALAILAGRDLAAGATMRAAAAVPEAYLALGLAALSLVYLARWAGIEVERRLDRSRWGVGVRALLAPYRAAGRLALAASDVVVGEPPRSVLADGLVVGRLPSERERASIRGEGIDAILNLCWEYPGLSPGGAPEVGRVPILDGMPPTARQFEDAVGQVVRWRSEGRRVLIHCAQGHGRSATIAAASLVRLGMAADAASALALIRAARPGARPSTAQIDALARYVAGLEAG